MGDLVGRTAELDALVEMLDRAKAGRGGLALLVGEPGIGKSRLADELSLEAEKRGFRIGWGRAWETGGAPAYYPWAQALAAVGLAAPDGGAATANDEVACFEMYRAVATTLRASTTPLLLVLDDVHAADVSSVRMLAFVARELRGTRVLLVATRRDADALITPEIDSLLLRIAREGRSFVLGRLDRADVARMVEDDALGDEIFGASQGNPLFVGELVRLVRADPRAARDGAMPIPYGAREILRQRLAQLDAAAIEVLRVFAVYGASIAEATLARAASVSLAEVARIAEEAVHTGIVVHAAEGELRFSHALLRDALARELPAARRAAIHARIVDVLETDRASSAVAIAHHAIGAGPDARFVARVLAGANALFDAHAHEDALRLLERARAMASAGAAELDLALARARFALGDGDRARADCIRAADSARAEDDGGLFGRAALLHASEVTVGLTHRAVHALLEEALERVPATEKALRLRLRARFAASLQPSKQPAAVGEEALAAIREARALGDDATLLDVMNDAGGALAEAYFAPEVVDVWRDAILLAQRFGDRAKLFTARMRFILASAIVGDFATVDATIDALENDAPLASHRRYLWSVPLLRAMRAMHEGRFDVVDALVAEAKELGGSDPGLAGALLFHRYVRMRAQERHEDALAFETGLLKVVATWNDASAYASLMMAGTRSLAADEEAARKHLLAVPLDSVPANVRISLGMMAAETVRLRERTHAAVLYDRVLPEADRWCVGSFGIEGTYARHLGGLATLLGRYDDAARHYDAALARAEAASAPLEAARTLVGHAEMLLARRAPGDETRARDMLARARAIADELGVVLTVREIPEAAPRSAKAAKPSAIATELRLERDGETWVLSSGSHVARLKDSRGLHYVERLVSQPHREIHALDLAGATEGTDAGDAGEVLDDAARAAYKRRLAELDEELREAEGWNDRPRVARARAEIDFLSAELARAIALGGKTRRVGSAAERARVAVTRRVKDVLRRVSEVSPELGRHFEATIKTGTFCVYRPLGA